MLRQCIFFVVPYLFCSAFSVVQSVDAKSQARVTARALSTAKVGCDFVVEVISKWIRGF